MRSGQRPPAKTSIDLTIVRLAGAWRQRRQLEQQIGLALPKLVQICDVLPPGLYTITLALSDDAHQRDLNYQFRGINRSTNVLSFPEYSKNVIKKLLPGKKPVHLGDISLSYQYVMAEAAEQGKKPLHHIIHLVIHGILHILGHDHQTARQAVVMEQLERDVLASMTIADPYNSTGAVQPRRRVAPRNSRRA